MKINKLLFIAPVAALAFVTSCNAAKRYEAKDYQLTLEWNKDHEHFNILQLTDLHISNASDNEKHFKFIEETVKKARAECQKDNEDIDLIVITGDMFTFAGKSEVNELFNFFDSLKVNWACTFGNHDEQAYFPVDWLTGRLNELNEKRLKNDGSSYCVFKDLQDDDVFGNANYVINLKKGKTLKEQLYIFDSNRYNFGEYRGYDYIHYDQIDWYERQLNFLGDTDKNVKSLAFFHIPFPDFEDNYKKAINKEVGFSFVNVPDNQGHDTSCGIPKKNTGLYDVMKKHHNTNGVFVGHDHTSTYIVKEDYKDPDTEVAYDITLGFGIKGTSNVYCDPTKLGGQIIKIHDGGTFDITRNIYHEYTE